MLTLQWWTERFSPSLFEMYNKIYVLLQQDTRDIMAQVNLLGNSLETLAVASCIIGVILQAKHNIWGWLFTALSAAIVPFILYNYYGLIGDAAVWAVMFLWFFTSAIWGWSYWINNRKEHARHHLGIGYSFREMVRQSHLADITLSPETQKDEVKRNIQGLGTMQLILLLPLGIFMVVALGWILSTLIPTMFHSWGAVGFRPSLPYWDALTTTLVCFAQLLLIGKYWEAWPLWASVSLLSIGVYAEKGAWTFVIMYIIIFIVAAISTISWYCAYREQKKWRWKNVIGM
ncbi:MAG: nicotinamide riboside transporter PnuC [Alphaproteobacteria bacterium]